jgi:hypothetical protein
MSMKLGATGRFPAGSLGPNDEGELQFAISRDSNGLVHINFGKDVSWLALEPETAIELAKTLLKCAGARKVTIEL